MQVIGIIPARFDSVRFPGKPLIDIRGKTMIQRVYERASMAKKKIPQNRFGNEYPRRRTFYLSRTN